MCLSFVLNLVNKLSKVFPSALPYSPPQYSPCGASNNYACK